MAEIFFFGGRSTRGTETAGVIERLFKRENSTFVRFCQVNFSWKLEAGSG